MSQRQKSEKVPYVINYPLTFSNESKSYGLYPEIRKRMHFNRQVGGGGIWVNPEVESFYRTKVHQWPRCGIVKWCRLRDEFEVCLLFIPAWKTFHGWDWDITACLWLLMWCLNMWQFLNGNTHPITKPSSQVNTFTTRLYMSFTRLCNLLWRTSLKSIILILHRLRFTRNRRCHQVLNRNWSMSSSSVLKSVFPSLGFVSDAVSQEL